MCGIIAVLSVDGPTLKDGPELKERLDAGLDRIAHRGPDGRGIWIDPSGICALAHCRLSINDLSPSANQPLHSPDRRIHAIVNGELYYPSSLRSALSESYPFQTQSDSELVIALYLQHGPSFLTQLRGEFALALYDSQERVFIAARDRYGIKPLFWRRTGGSVQISAEIKGFLGLGWQAEWDVGSIADGGWGQDTRTMFKGVNKVYTANFVVAVLKANSSDPASFADKIIQETRSEEEIVAHVRSLLVDSVRLRLRADVPVGIYLSGGIDSSALAGIAAHLVKEEGLTMGSQKADERMCCFSIGFEESSGFDESAISQRTANHLGVKFLKAHMSETELASRFEDAVYHIEHTNHDLNFVGKYALSEVPRKHGYKVVLTGEGADEHFAGYPLYQPDFLREADLAWSGQSVKIDPAERPQIVTRMEDVIKESYEVIGATSEYFEEPTLRKQMNGLSTPSAMCAIHPFMSIFKPWVRKEHPRNPLATIASNIPPHVLASIQTQWHPLHSAMYIWTQGHLANNFLSCLGDRVEMAHSVEARTPFLDHHLTDYINHLPPSLKIKHTRSAEGKDVFTEKYVLREAVKPFVTEEVYKRTKHPYSAPTAYEANGPIQKMLETWVTRENVDRLGFMQWEEVETLLGVAFGSPSGLSKEVVRAWRIVLVVAEYVVLSRRFDISPAASREG